MFPKLFFLLETPANSSNSLSQGKKYHERQCSIKNNNSPAFYIAFLKYSSSLGPGVFRGSDAVLAQWDLWAAVTNQNNYNSPQPPGHAFPMNQTPKYLQNQFWHILIKQTNAVFHNNIQIFLTSYRVFLFQSDGIFCIVFKKSSKEYWVKAKFLHW